MVPRWSRKTSERKTTVLKSGLNLEVRGITSGPLPVTLVDMAVGACCNTHIGMYVLDHCTHTHMLVWSVVQKKSLCTSLQCWLAFKLRPFLPSIFPKRINLFVLLLCYFGWNMDVDFYLWLKTYWRDENFKTPRQTSFWALPSWEVKWYPHAARHTALPLPHPPVSLSPQPFRWGYLPNWGNYCKLSRWNFLSLSSSHTHLTTGREGTQGEGAYSGPMFYSWVLHMFKERIVPWNVKKKVT